jgi:hypothetical protein
MRQATPIKWIEVAEARIVRQLAVMEPGKIKISRCSDLGSTMQRIRLFKLFRLILRTAVRRRNG